MKEYQLISDLKYEYNADVGLSYSSPVRGVWNIVHIGTLVPEAHEIFVCPTSCLRGVVLTTAEMGAMDRLSTITVGEDNILDGDMEEALQHGTERIISELPERPRALLIYTSCIHHFLAVNYQRVYKVLRKKYPDIDFIDCYMDPIMRRTAPAIPSLWRQIMRLLTPERMDAARQRISDITPSGKKAQANYVGNCFPHSKYCDLTCLFNDFGIRVMEVNKCGTYDEFLNMAGSPVNFTFHKTAFSAAKDMKLRLDQEWISMSPGYYYDQIDEDMNKAADFFGVKRLSEEHIQNERLLTEAAVLDIKDLLAGTPVSIDYTAVDRPLELAVYLIEHGFNIESVFVDVFTESEEVFDKLKSLSPSLKIYQSLGWNIRKMKRGHEGKILAIGQKSAYFMDTDNFVNIIENEGMYGYKGIRRLMELIKEAFMEEKNMKELVQIKGWGCGCA